MTGPCSDNYGANERSIPGADGCPFRFFFTFAYTNAFIRDILQFIFAGGLQQGLNTSSLCVTPQWRRTSRRRNAAAPSIVLVALIVALFIWESSAVGLGDPGIDAARNSRSV